MKKDGQRWTRAETLVVFNHYWNIPSAHQDKRNPDIIKLADLIGRSAGSVAMKMRNLTSQDPDAPQKGLSSVSKLDRQVWEEYFADPEELIFESETAVASFDGQTIEKRAGIERDLVDFPEGKERERKVKARTNSEFFRRTVFFAYRSRCCVTGLEMRSLLNACHIIPWSENAQRRLDPRNGLCMNVLLHRAFDLGLMTVMPNGEAKISSRLIESARSSEWAAFVVECDGRKIEMPERFYPGREFLEYHNREIFEKI